MKMVSQMAISMVIGLTVAACSSQDTIGGLDAYDDSEREEQALDFKNLDHKAVRDEYQEIVDLVDDAYLKEQIKRRIAGVHMLEGDDDITRDQAAPKNGYYRDAIDSYIDILEKYPNSPDNAEVLYQLAKAYDIEGQTKNARQMLERLVNRHPYYPNLPEVHFRLGDLYFNNAKYNKAEQAYRKTTQAKTSKLLLNSHYMLAWTLYKQGVYHKSLNHFSYVLNDLLTAELSGRKLNNIEKPLVKDTLHSMSLALVNLGGASAIEDIDLLQGKAFVWRVYADLADFYIQKSRYDDTAVTYRNFIAMYPMDERAAVFNQRLINAYVKGAFPKLVLSEKESYSDRYASDSKYYATHVSLQKEIKVNLKNYYAQLAAHFHSQGQQALKKYEKNPKHVHLSTIAGQSLTQAADFYDRYLILFPNDNAVTELRYKKADAHFENKQYVASAQDYNVVAYSKGRYKLTNKAAYAGIIALNLYVDELTEKNADKETLDKWQAASLQSMLKFSKVFHNDKRSISVLTNAAQAMFALNQYDRAIEVATSLIKKTAKLNVNLKKTAYGILGHSYFKKGQYQHAQNNYLAQRKLVKKASSDYVQISEQVAASIFKKAEQLKAKNKPKLAINELLSIKHLAGQSKIRVLAQYDAASMLLAAKEWERAIKELKQLEKTFVKHELAAQFPRKLAFAYEQKKDWVKSAQAYSDLSKEDKSPKVRQEAMFIAAGLFEKMGQDKRAIEFFRDYAHKYEKPFDNRMEARFRLASLYEKGGDKTRQLFWLRRVIAGNDTAGDTSTDRSRWLAAWANGKYGDYFAWEFTRRKLRLPIENSMLKKNQYLGDATARYEMAAAYGILEFTSMASYKIADLYEHFGVELNSAPVPEGLSEQDLVLYQAIMTEQSEPFTTLAAVIYQSNVDLSWQGHFNDWIVKSFDAMKRLSPARFDKEEEIARYGDEIR
jgi:tetratricopeptide (TPR) repeat protein